MIKPDPKKKLHKAKKASSTQILIQDLKSQLSRVDERVDKLESLFIAIAQGLTKQDNLNRMLANNANENRVLIANLSNFVNDLADVINKEN